MKFGTRKRLHRKTAGTQLLNYLKVHCKLSVSPLLFYVAIAELLYDRKLSPLERRK